MKRLLIIGLFISLLFFGVGIKAFDIRGNFEKVKDVALSVFDRARSVVSSAVDEVKNITISVFHKVTDAITSMTTAALSAPMNIRGYIADSTKGFIKERQQAIIDNPYKDAVALVRIGNELNSDERAYVTKRKPKVKIALEKMLGRSLDGKNIPTIALVCSGGGYRAMLGTIGSLLAVEKIGLLDAAMYMTGLSGSTWALNSWISTGMSLDKFKDYICKTITKNIHIANVDEATNIFNTLLVKACYDQPITLVDLYGGLLSNRLLSFYGKDNQRVYLSQQAERIMRADIPYPIYTAIDAVVQNPHWFEFTPHEMGAAYFSAYIPMWAYGRKCNNGKTIDFAPEQSLGFQMGTFGSAFGVHFQRAWDEIADEIPDSILKSAIEKKFINQHFDKRISHSWADVFNFMYGMPGQELKDSLTLQLVDAGIDFNLPYPPISGERLERKADIMLFLDFSMKHLLMSLKKIEKYARTKGLKFPVIDYVNVDKKVCSVFKDESDPSVPVVILFPCISDPELWKEHKLNPLFEAYNSIEGFDFSLCDKGGFCDMRRFQYTLQHSEKVIDQMEFNIMINKDKIIDEINWVIDQQK